MAVKPISVPSRFGRTILLMVVAIAALVAFSGSATATHLGCDHHPDGQCGTPSPVTSITVIGRSQASGELRWSQWPDTPQKYNVYLNGRYETTVLRHGPSPVASLPLPARVRSFGSVYVIPIKRSVAGQEWIGLRHEAWTYFYWWNGSKYETTIIRRGT